MALRLAFRTKMILPAAAVVLASLAATAATLTLSGQAARELNRVEKERAPALEASRDAEELLQRLQRHLQDAAAAEDLAALDSAEELQGLLRERLDETQAAGLTSVEAAALRNDLDAYFMQARQTTERLIRHQRGDDVAAGLREMSARYLTLRSHLEQRTARARTAMAAGFDSARRLQTRAAWLGPLLLVLSALGAAALSSWLAAGVSRPLEALQLASWQLAEGDLTVPIDVHSSDEVGALADAFRAMAERMRTVIGALRTSSTELSGAALELERLTRVQNAALERQASGVAQTSSTTRELDQSASVAAGRATSVLEVARRAAEVGAQGQASAARSAAGLQKIQDAIGLIVSQGTRLMAQASAVGEIVETVKDLATQSHVLSLNASIEAVRAGEAGKGFGVVATEVRGLAEQSGQAAARIGRLMQEIQAAIQATLDLTDRSRRGMEGSLDAIRASGQSLGDIGAIVQETSEAALQIAALVQQQSTGVGQIAGAMRDLNAGMEETVTRIHGLEQASAHLKAASARIAETVSELKVE